MELKDIGYRQATAVDWAGLTDKIAKGISNIGVAKVKSDEETNKIYDDTVKKLNQVQDLNNNNLTSFVLDGSKKYKDYALDLHNKWKAGEITSNDVKKRLSNAQEHWVDFANHTKDVDARYQLFVDRQTPDANGWAEGSDAEFARLALYADMADIKDKTPVIGADGAMYMQKPDGSLIDWKDLSKPENIQIDRVDLNKAIDAATSNWAAEDIYSTFGRGGEKTTSSIKNQGGGKDYELMKINATEAILSNPLTTVSVLVDNGVINKPMYYTSDSEKDYDLAKLIVETKAKYEAVGKEFTDEDRKKLENSFIKWEKDDNGIFMPALTEDQINLAKQRVAKGIDMSIETQVAASAPPVYAPQNNNANEPETPKEVFYGDYAKAYKAYNSANADVLKAMSGNKYTFQWTDKEGVIVKDSDGKEIFRGKSLTDLQPYLGGISLEKWEKQKAAFNAKAGGGGGGGAAKPSEDDPLGIGVK